MEYQTLTFDVTDGLAIITMNRPDRLNALTGDTFNLLASWGFDIPREQLKSNFDPSAIFKLAVNAPAMLELAIELDGKGEVSQLGIATLQLDTGADMAGPAVIGQGTDRAGQPAAGAVRRFGQVNRCTAEAAVFFRRGRRCWIRRGAGSGW